MAMAASTYAYITGEDLEEFMGLDLSTIDAAVFIDANVIMQITTAEELINAFLGVSAAQTVTNAITLSTKFISAWLVNKLAENTGFQLETQSGIYALTWVQLWEMVKGILTSDVGVDSIPMSGATR